MDKRERYQWTMGAVAFTATKSTLGWSVCGTLIGTVVLSYSAPGKWNIERVACQSRFRVIDLLRQWQDATVNSNIEIMKL